MLGDKKQRHFSKGLFCVCVCVCVTQKKENDDRICVSEVSVSFESLTANEVTVILPVLKGQ